MPIAPFSVETVLDVHEVYSCQRGAKPSGHKLIAVLCYHELHYCLLALKVTTILLQS